MYTVRTRQFEVEITAAIGFSVYTPIVYPTVIWIRWASWIL